MNIKKLVTFDLKKGLLIFLVLTFATYGIQAVGAIKVELVENTDQCLTNCYSIYRITAEGTELTLNEETFWFEFRQNIKETSQHGNTILGLKDFAVSMLVDKNVTKPEWIITSNCGTDENCTETGKWENTTKIMKVYQSPPPTKILAPDESVYLKVDGKKHSTINIDNIPVLYDPTNPKSNPSGYVKYDEFAWWNTNWINCRVVTLTNPTSENLVDFPFYLNFNASELTSSGLANGSDIRFNNGTTCTNADSELAFEIEDYNDTDTANESIWLKVNLTASSTTTITMYYNNSAGTLPSPTSSIGSRNTWNSAYVGVYHVNNSFSDSTYTVNGTNSGTIDSVGNVSRAREWDGVDDYIGFGDVNDFTTAYTIEAWVNKDKVTCTPLEAIMSKWGTIGPPRTWGLFAFNSAGTDCDFLNFVVNLTEIATNNILTVANTWYYTVGVFVPSTSITTYAGNATTGYLYNVGTNTVGVPAYSTGTSGMMFGRENNTLSILDGDGDEFRLSNVARNTSWLNATYLTIANRTKYRSFGSENIQLVPIASNITNETWETTGLFDSGGVSNYTINITIDQNFYNNISDVNFSINGNIYSDAQIQNTSGGVGQTNWTRFNISVYTPLVQTNNTPISFNWTWISTGNSSTEQRNNSNKTQNVNWGWYINNQTYTSPILSDTPNNIRVNFTKHVVGGVGLNYNVTSEWNQTNRTTTQLLTNNSGNEEWNITFLTPRVYVITSVQMKGWLNITFNGSMVNRDPNFTQIIEPDANHTLDLTAFETSLVNFTMNVTNTSPILNVNFSWNATTQIGSNITNITAGNYTRFNASRRVPLISTNNTNVTTQWNWSTSTQSLSTNLTNQSLFWAHYPNRLHMPSGVTEGDSQTDTVNVTKHIFIGTTTRTVNLEYNQTNVSTTLVFNVTPFTYSEYNATFTTSLVLVDTSVQAKGWLNVSFGGQNYFRNTSNSTQLIVNINVTAGTNCTNVTGSVAVLNFTFHDEFTNQSLAENGSSQITIWNLTQTSNQTFGFKFFNTTFHTICLQPPVNFTGDYFLQYENWTNSTASYPEREFWKRNQSIDNVTDQYHLYSILLSNSTDIIFNVQDSNSDPAPNVIVEAFKYNISNNSFMLVDSGITDFDGKTRLRLFKADDYYKIIARDGGGKLVLETSLFKILFNEYFLRLEPFGLTTIGTVIQLKNIPHNLTFDNGTMRAVLTWNDVMNVSGQSCLEITNMTGNNTGVIINKQCSTNISGSFQFDFTGLNGSYVAKYVAGQNSFLIDAIDVLLSGFTNLGRNGLFMAFLLIGTFTAVGIVINPTLGVVFFMVGFIGTWLTGLLQISWLPFTGVIAICLIAAFILKKDIV